jgi:transcriptional regulator with PAS, ATPase and Fis domain
LETAKGNGLKNADAKSYAEKDVMIQRLLNQIDTSYYVLDSEGRFIFVNNAFTRYTQTPREIFLGKCVYDIAQTFSPSIFEMVRRLSRKVSIYQDIIAYDKKRYRQLATATPMLDEKGNLEQVIVQVEALDEMTARMKEAGRNDVSYMTMQEKSKKTAKSGKISYTSKAMQDLFSRASKIAMARSSCLLTGESGVGKDVVAQYIYDCSPRKKEMIVINCAAMPETLMEAELFGYEKGAFTGGERGGKIGAIESADSGILFLDEINSLPLELQGKLLRVLETKRVKRLGAVREKQVDFQLIVATNENLLDLCERKLFRCDLYYRINVVQLVIPPLRKRVSDIIPLAQTFLSEFCERYSRVKTFSQEVYRSLLAYSWPGNVRELRNCVENMVLMSDDDVVEIEKLPFYMIPSSQDAATPPASGDRIIVIDCNNSVSAFSEDGFSLKEYMDRVEDEIIGTMMETYRNSYKVADLLHINQSTVIRKHNRQKTIKR